MKKQDGYYYVESREIDLKRMLWWIARQWRMLIVLALACACVMVAWKYNKDYKANLRAYEAALAEIEKEETTLEEVEATLNDDEINGARWALYYYTRAKHAEDYLENSLLMRVNPYAIDVMYIYYQAEDVSAAKVKLEQLLLSEVFLENLRENLGWEIETHYLLELFEVEEDGEQVIISIKADSQSNCTAIAENTISMITENFPQNIKEIKHMLGVTTDLTLVTAYIDILDQKNTYNSQYRNYQSNFVVAQDTLFHKMLAEQEGIVIEEESTEEVVIERTKTYISKPMFALGGIAGLILACVGLAVLYTFSINVHGTAEMRYLFELPFMGTVNVAGLKKKKMFACFDKFLNSIEYGKDAKMSYEEQLKMIVSNVYIACKKENVKKIYVSGTEINDVPEAFIVNVKKALEEKGIEFSAGKAISYDAESLLEAEEVGNVLLIEFDEVSKCDEIAKELNLCVQNRIKNLGIIMAQY